MVLLFAYRVVPLALALLNISHPDFAVIDQLSRLTHDADADVAQSAIMVRTTPFAVFRWSVSFSFVPMVASTHCRLLLRYALRGFER